MLYFVNNIYCTLEKYNHVCLLNVSNVCMKSYIESLLFNQVGILLEVLNYITLEVYYPHCLWDFLIKIWFLDAK